ncbi:MAG: PAS domain-containing protein [Desulfuromonadaceae bacterium]|nr:PAS domain-containing protein [Desulfuromonadaceae bacterium]
MGRGLKELLIFNSFLKNTKDSIVVKEYFATEDGRYSGGVIVCASAEKANHYGLTMDTIRGRTDFDLMSREQAEKALQDDIWVLSNGQPLEDIRETITHGDGETVLVSVSKFPWILPGGEIVGVMCIARKLATSE